MNIVEPVQALKKVAKISSSVSGQLIIGAASIKLIDAFDAISSGNEQQAVEDIWAAAAMAVIILNENFRALLNKPLDTPFRLLMRDRKYKEAYCGCFDDLVDVVHGTKFQKMVEQQ